LHDPCSNVHIDQARCQRNQDQARAEQRGAGNDQQVSLADFPGTGRQRAHETARGQRADQRAVGRRGARPCLGLVGDSAAARAGATDVERRRQAQGPQRNVAQHMRDSIASCYDGV
jgi:hypothetical protein